MGTGTAMGEGGREREGGKRREGKINPTRNSLNKQHVLKYNT